VASTATKYSLQNTLIQPWKCKCDGTCNIKTKVQKFASPVAQTLLHYEVETMSSWSTTQCPTRPFANDFKIRTTRRQDSEPCAGQQISMLVADVTADYTWTRSNDRQLTAIRWHLPPVFVVYNQSHLSNGHIQPGVVGFQSHPSLQAQHRLLRLLPGGFKVTAYYRATTSFSRGEIGYMDELKDILRVPGPGWVSSRHTTQSTRRCSARFHDTYHTCSIFLKICSF